MKKNEKCVGMNNMKFDMGFQIVQFFHLFCSKFRLWNTLSQMQPNTVSFCLPWLKCCTTSLFHGYVRINLDTVCCKTSKIGYNSEMDTVISWLHHAHRSFTARVLIIWSELCQIFFPKLFQNFFKHCTKVWPRTFGKSKKIKAKRRLYVLLVEWATKVFVESLSAQTDASVVILAWFLSHPSIVGANDFSSLSSIFLIQLESPTSKINIQLTILAP